MYYDKHVRVRKTDGSLDYLQAIYNFDEKKLTLADGSIDQVLGVYCANKGEWVEDPEMFMEVIKDEVLEEYNMRCKEYRRDFLDRDVCSSNCSCDCSCESKKGSCK